MHVVSEHSIRNTEWKLHCLLSCGDLPAAAQGPRRPRPLPPAGSRRRRPAALRRRSRSSPSRLPLPTPAPHTAPNRHGAEWIETESSQATLNSSHPTSSSPASGSGGMAYLWRTAEQSPTQSFALAHTCTADWSASFCAADRRCSAAACCHRRCLSWNKNNRNHIPPASQGLIRAFQSEL